MNANTLNLASTLLLAGMSFALADACGMAWLPAYTVDTSDPVTLTIRQSAVVRNELMDIKGTSLDLISGYPNIKFSHVDSPLNPDTPLATFFQQLNSQGNSSPSTMSQMVSFNFWIPY